MLSRSPSREGIFCICTQQWIKSVSVSCNNAAGLFNTYMQHESDREAHQEFLKIEFAILHHVGLLEHHTNFLRREIRAQLLEDPRKVRKLNVALVLPIVHSEC